MEWLREYLPFVIGLGLFGLIAIILFIDLFIYPILNDPPRQTNSESEQSYQITPSRSNQER